MKSDTTDFRKVTSRTDEVEQKPKVKFKVVPPPPKLKVEPPPPAPPPPRKSASPKLRRPKRKVEVDVFRLCWKESWMSLKPPKYLYLKAKESKPVTSGFISIQLNNRKYKAQHAALDAEPTCVLKWSQSWKLVSLAQAEDLAEK